MKQAKIVLMRHGECQGGAILRGKTDVGLTARGEAQMAYAFSQIDAITSLHVNPRQGCQLFSSPLVRCNKMAASFSKQLNAPLVVLPELAELDFGDWDGQLLNALYVDNADALNAFWLNPWLANNIPPNGESMQAFEARVNNGFTQILKSLLNGPVFKDSVSKDDAFKDYCSKDSAPNAPMFTEHASNKQTALVVTHGGVIRHLISLVLGLSQCASLYSQLKLDYAAVVEIDVFFQSQNDFTSLNDKNLSLTLNWPSITAKMAE